MTNTEIIQRYFVTFGQKSPFRNSYVEVVVRDAASEEEARKRVHDAAMDVFGDKWSNLYPHEDFSKCCSLFTSGRIGEVIEA